MDTLQPSPFDIARLDPPRAAHRLTADEALQVAAGAGRPLLRALGQLEGTRVDALVFRAAQVGKGLTFRRLLAGLELL